MIRERKNIKGSDYGNGNGGGRGRTPSDDER